MSGMVQSLDPAEMAGWRAFIESSQRLLTQLEDDLRETSELSFADYHVLVLLSEAPRQRLRMGELASKLIFSPSRLTYQIGTMERAAWSPGSPARTTGGAARRCSPPPGCARCAKPHPTTCARCASTSSTTSTTPRSPPHQDLRASASG